MIIQSEEQNQEKSFYIDSPLIESTHLSRKLGPRVYLKIDALQPTGSFKIRGVENACRTYIKLGCEQFLVASGGNAGLAVAYVSRKLNVTCTVVVPITTKLAAIDAIKKENATVVVHGENWHQANEHALSLKTEKHAYIHPFDDPLLWTGHSSIIDEIAKTEFVPDAVIVAVGGGGLLSGVAQGMIKNVWDKTTLIAVETYGADCLARSLQAGKSINMESITSIASSLGASYVCDRALEAATMTNFLNFVVSDKEAVQASRNFLYQHRIAVEPACGAALAVVYENYLEGYNFDKVVIIVCGGVGIDFNNLFPQEKLRT